MWEQAKITHLLSDVFKHYEIKKCYASLSMCVGQGVPVKICLANSDMSLSPPPYQTFTKGRLYHFMFCCFAAKSQTEILHVATAESLIVSVKSIKRHSRSTDVKSDACLESQEKSVYALRKLLRLL
jgi:ribosomal protein S26